MGDARQVGIGAARDARTLIAGLLEARGRHPDFARDLSGTIGVLYGLEVGDDEALLDALKKGLERLRALIAVDRWTDDPEVARTLSRACAILHPAVAELSRALRRSRDDATAPFLLGSARVRSSRTPEQGDRRDADRTEIEAHVGLEGDSRFFTGRAGDLSRGGLFLATESPLPVGTLLALSFVLPDGYRVKAEATVAWVRAPRYRPHELPAGMGVQFAQLAEADLAAIHHFLEERPAFFYGD